MTSPAVLSSARSMPPHLGAAPRPERPYSPVVVEDVQHPAVPISSSTAASAPSTSSAQPTSAVQAPRKRPRSFRPPPLVVPDPPPTSLPPSFYSENSPRSIPPPSPKPAWAGDPRTAAATRKGIRRRHNEDRVFANAQVGVYGVCDGHGGTDASEKVAEVFPLLMAQGYTLKDAFARADELVCSMFSKQSQSFTGTTLTAIQVKRGGLLKVAHVGDSRAMVVDNTGRPTTLTRDHAPTRQDEVRRIEKAGGGVFQGRVNGVLAVSRAIGDTGLKPVVTAEPEELEYALTSEDQIVVLASDGLWDRVSATEVVTYLRSRPTVANTAAVPIDLAAAATGLVDLAVSRGSKDDTSVVLVDIRNSF